MEGSNRILVVDDQKDIHEDFKKILKNHMVCVKNDQLKKLEYELFEDELPTNVELQNISYRIDSAFQGKQAIDMVDMADAEGDPYSLIFMDVRMPPGLNGIATMEKIWQKHPFIEMVIVTAYSDYSWEQILERVGTTDRLMFLRKPFDQVSVKQMALALTKKFHLTQKVRGYIDKIEKEIFNRHHQLEKMLHELKVIN